VKLHLGALYGERLGVDGRGQTPILPLVARLQLSASAPRQGAIIR
jgi:hypothetical protein